MNLLTCSMDQYTLSYAHKKKMQRNMSLLNYNQIFKTLLSIHMVQRNILVSF